MPSVRLINSLKSNMSMRRIGDENNDNGSYSRADPTGDPRLPGKRVRSDHALKL